MNLMILTFSIVLPNFVRRSENVYENISSNFSQNVLIQNVASTRRSLFLVDSLCYTFCNQAIQLYKGCLWAVNESSDWTDLIENYDSPLHHMK